MERKVRSLKGMDEPALRRFMLQHPYTTMFFRNNLAMAGLVDGRGRYEGHYVGAFDGSDLVGLAAHYWNDNLVIEAPVALEAVATAAVAGSGRPVKGLVGPHEQTVAARQVLGLQDRATTMDSPEILYALELDALVVPEALGAGQVRSRRATLDDLDTLVPWRVAYFAELSEGPDTPAEHAAQRASVRSWIREGRVWVLEKQGRIVAMTGFNAALPDAVQIGGVFTPPERRGRGFARCAVAGSLRDARGEGVARAVLFTGHDNVPAQRAYEALGFEAVGDYGLILFR